MGKKAANYTVSGMMWACTAICDQWQKVMAVYDDSGNLRAVVNEIDEEEKVYHILLIGDDDVELYETPDLQLGSTGKNLKACFEIYWRLQGEGTSSYIPSYRKDKAVSLYDIFPHTRKSALRAGGFHVSNEDHSSKIAEALEVYESYAEKLEPRWVDHCEGEEYYRYDYRDNW